jgi:predicted amino acid dehydrogenase
MAERLGAHMLGLGAYTSVVGDAGVTVSRSLDIPVTTGDSYTVSVAVQAILKAAEVMEIAVGSASAAVVGATGAIGSICAELLADEVAELYLIGRREDVLEDLRARISAGGAAANLHTSTSMDVLREMQMVLTVTSSFDAIIQPEHLRPGSVVCDVSRPRDVSAQVAAIRDDVLVIDGGMVDVPGPVDFHFDFGFPPGKAYACMAETMALVLEGHFENFTLGKNISRDKVEEITAIAGRHGFKLSGFRSFEKPVTPKHIDRVRQRARAGRR